MKLGLFAAAAVLALSASAQAVTYSEVIALNGSATGSSGFGAANVQLNVSDTNQLSYNIIFTGLSGPLTGAEFRNGTGVTVDIGAVSGLSGSNLVGATTLTQAQVNDLFAGNWRITLDTALHPLGEISGALPGVTPAAVPEPAVASLLLMSVAALGWRVARRV
jgi:hypothetical protein